MQSKFLPKITLLSILFCLNTAAFATIYHQENQQGWSSQERNGFYHTPQGSPIMPYAWFLALEAADGNGLFADEANLVSYGFIPSPYKNDPTLNPDGLPIGLTIEPELDHAGKKMLDQPYLGMTCAACHTGEISINGKSMIVDGAPGRLDFDRFVADLSKVIKRTSENDDILTKMAVRFTGSTDETALKQWIEGFKRFKTRFVGDATMRRPILKSGFGRVDALTQIINSMAARDQAMPLNLSPVEAPVSYPQIWLAPRLEYVQWNPIAASPIVRNGGQVLGVFGNLNLTKPDDGLLSSSMRIENLKVMEDWLETLEPPKWDEATMGAIDRSLANSGKDLFKKSCNGCHITGPLDDPMNLTEKEKNLYQKQFIKIKRVPYPMMGTDTAYFDALKDRQVLVSPIARLVLLELDKPSINQFLSRGDVLPAALFFGPLAYATVEKELIQRGIPAEERRKEYHESRFSKGPDGLPVGYEPETCVKDNPKMAFVCIKAPMLQGVWATAPYLHNGSVPTIDDLLKPAGERETVFWTGGKVLNTEKLGYEFGNAPGRYRFDTSIKGNHNTGHDSFYPEGGFDANQRKAIIEYLKTL